MSYNFGTGEGIGLKAQTVPATSPVRSSDEAQASFSLSAVPVYFRFGAFRTTFKAVQRDYDTCRGLKGDPDEAEVPQAAGHVDLDAFVEAEQLCDSAGDTDDVAEEALNATRLLVKAVDHDFPISKKRYLDLVRALAEKVQESWRESDASTQQLPEKVGNIGELKLKLSLLSMNSSQCWI